MLPCARILLGLCLLSGPGPSISRTALEDGRWLGFHEGGVEEMEVVCKWWPKWSSPNSRLLSEFIGERSAMLEENHSIKSQSSLQIFSDRGHTARMHVHTGRMEAQLLLISE
jgi:hypothetical protein